MKAKTRVLPDVRHGRVGELAAANDSGEIAVEEGDAGAFDGNICSGAHGEPDVGRCECWGDVDPGVV